MAYLVETPLDRIALRLGQALIACEQMGAQIEDLNKRLAEQSEKPAAPTPHDPAA